MQRFKGPAQAHLELGLGVADDLVVALGRDRVGDEATVVGLTDRGGDDYLLLGKAQAAKLHGQPPERPRITAGRGGVGTRHLGHRIEAVQDPPWQPNRSGELVVKVDRVGVARRLGVPLGEPAIGGHTQLGKRVAGLVVAHPYPLEIV